LLDIFLSKNISIDKSKLYIHLSCQNKYRQLPVRPHHFYNGSSLIIPKQYVEIVVMTLIKMKKHEKEREREKKTDVHIKLEIDLVGLQLIN